MRRFKKIVDLAKGAPGLCVAAALHLAWIPCVPFFVSRLPMLWPSLGGALLILLLWGVGIALLITYNKFYIWRARAHAAADAAHEFVQYEMDRRVHFAMQGLAKELTERLGSKITIQLDEPNPNRWKQ